MTSCTQYRKSLWLGAGWGFAEATLFFIVPDLVISWAALFSFRRAMKQLAVVVAGSLAGGLLFYGLAAARPAPMRALVGKVPFVRLAMFETVDADYVRHGAAALCRGPLSGIPYKVYAVLAPGHVRPLPFVLVSIPARLERLAASLVLFLAAGWIIRRFFPRPAWLPAAVFGLYWTGTYLFYWMAIG